MDIDVVSQPLETVAIDELRPHHRNYRSHPEDQIEHLVARIKKFGIYRNVVVARDNTILAGHGVTEAARRAGLSEVPVRRMDIDPESVKALELLAGDNEVEHLARNDDRALTELLKEINENGEDGLLGTGYDGIMLANLAMVTRSASEIRDHNEAAHWVGLPDYEEEEKPYKIVINFDTEDERKAYAEESGIRFMFAKEESKVWSARYPFEGRDDLNSLIFEG